MTFTIPTAVHNMQADWDTDPRARGAMGTQPGTRNTKLAGWLPLTGSNATSFVHNSDGNDRGVWWEFLATGGYDMTSQHRIMIITWQYNAPNRVEIDTAANNGFIWALGCGTGSPPTVWRKWRIAGNDKVGGQARENPKCIVLDLADTSNDLSSGTWDNTDIECFGFSTRQAHIGGSTNMVFFQRMFVLETTKNATNIPRFTGSGSDWDDIITALGSGYTTKTSDEWLKREGTVFSLACPVEFGNNSTVTTFNDNGAFVFWRNHNDTGDPRIRVTEDAFRVYANLRNNAADSITMSGYYDCGNSYPPWDFDLDFACTIDIDTATFNRVGQFDMGSSVEGGATFNDCKEIVINNTGVDLDGSTFQNPQGDHLLKLNV